MTDVPYQAKWLVSGYPSDEWVVIQENTATIYPTWTQGSIGRDSASYCDASSKTLDANSYYFSRPVYLEAGKTYELKFNTITNSDNPLDTNAMQVFWASGLDTNALIGNYLFSKTNINNAGLRQTVYVTPTQDSAYYFVFRALCKAGNKPLYIYGVTVREVQDIDAQVISLQTPVNRTYRYTDSETVTVRVGNGGLQAIAAGNMKVYYQLDDNARMEETISVPLALGETTDHTFSSTIDMEDLKTYNVKIGVILDNDEVPENDVLNLPITPLVTDLPYNGSLGTSINNRTYEEEYWTSVNNKWNIAFTASEVRWAYGGTGGSPATAVATLYSRPIHINAGSTCRFNYSVARSNASATVIPSFQVGVYQKVGNTYNLVVLANDTVIKTAANAYTTYTHDFIPATEGDYYFGYVLTPPVSGLTYNVYLKEPAFTLVSDLGISQIVSPTFTNNCTSATPITVKIHNYGSGAVYSAQVSYQINAALPVTENISFSPALAAGASYIYTFSQTADMGAAIDYTLTTYTGLSGNTGDSDDTNDTARVTIVHGSYRQYGDIYNPVYASPTTMSSGSPRTGLLNNGSMYTAYWHSSGPGRYNLHAQILDPRGVPQWENELIISNNEKSSSIVYDAVADKQGNFILGFTNMPAAGDMGEVRISKINANKEYLFGEEGVVLNPMSSPLMACKVIRTDSHGDIYAALFTGGASYTTSHLYKLDGQTGSIITSIQCNVSTMEFDKNDNLYVAFQDQENVLKLQVYNTDLIPLHAEPALVTPSGVNSGSGAALSILKFDNSGGVWVSYYSQSMYNNTYFVQYIDDKFMPKIGTTGVAVSNNTSRHRTNGWPVFMDDEDVLAFAFAESAAGGAATDYIKGQKIRKDGTLLMGAAGTDILDPVPGAATLDVNGLYYKDSVLILNYNFGGGVGSTARLNSALAFYNRNFGVPYYVQPYAMNNYIPISFKTASNHYGVYTAWVSNLIGDGSPTVIMAQHVYFDTTMVNKAFYVNVKSHDPSMGYATGGGLLNAGDMAFIEATPLTGNEFVEWRVNGNAVSTENPYQFAVTGDITLTAVFRIVPPSFISASTSAGGTINPSGEIEVPSGGDKTFVFTPDLGYNLVEVLVDNIANTSAVTAGLYTFSNVTQNHTIYARFEPQTFTITASASNGGGINPSGNVSVFYGDDKVFTFTPNEAYELTEVLIDGTNNPAAVENGEYTFTNITLNHTIEARFELAGSIRNFGNDEYFSITPNPVRSGATFSLHGKNTEELQGLSVNIYDMSGCLQSTQITDNGAKLTAPAASGMYILQITYNDSKKYLKLIVNQ